MPPRKRTQGENETELKRGELKNGRKWPEVQRKHRQRGSYFRVAHPLKMFTGLLRVKWAANAVTSMQTTSKHNSLIHCIVVELLRAGAFVTVQSAGSNQVMKQVHARCSLTERKRNTDGLTEKGRAFSLDKPAWLCVNHQ